MRVSLHCLEPRLLEPCFERALALLPPGRRKKALGFKMPDDRLRSLAAGLLLRRYLGVVSDGDIVLGPHGRPELASGASSFSLSHSGALAALSISSAVHGLDVEDLSRSVKTGLLLKRILSSDEEPFREELALRPEAFFSLWTRKESLMKASGLGFRLDPKTFTVWPPDPGPVRALGRDWHLLTLVHAGHAVSIAAEDGPIEARPETVNVEDSLAPPPAGP